ncbi:MAG: nucleotide sugar dehydrogenase [Acetobacterales bacterium]
MSQQRIISVIGLGYVGLPVAAGFAAAGFEVIGFDVNRQRIGDLRAGIDRTGEVQAEALRAPTLHLTAEAADIARADFYIVTVPTPVTGDFRPDLSPLLAASRTVGRCLSRGDIVVYESTVYPGATEEDCVPVLEAESGLLCGQDFTVGYSPERINPGDPEHRFENITKVVSGQDEATLDIVAGVYGRVVRAGVHRAPTIRTAEAAKVIENTQRDLNIALMNELAIIFDKLDIDTGDVLAAAGTKWNFLRFSPGLVGGHCIGVDPYYLTHRAERAGYQPNVILAGRRINDGMGAYAAREAIKRLMRTGRLNGTGRPRAAILGLTFKEDVPDIRNTKVVDMVREFRAFGFDVEIADPLADAHAVGEEFNFDLTPLDEMTPADVVVLAVPHRSFREAGWPAMIRRLNGETGLVVDIRGVLDRTSRPDGVDLWRL